LSCQVFGADRPLLSTLNPIPAGDAPEAWVISGPVFPLLPHEVANSKTGTAAAATDMTDATSAASAAESRSRIVDVVRFKCSLPLYPVIDF
jgi:hypothetical protein